MLQSIRDQTQGWIAGVIISMLILSFALWGIHSYLGEGASNSYVAKVNGVEITKAQFAVAYERLRRQLQMQFNSSYQVPEQAEANLKSRALQALINIQVLKQASHEQGYRISSAQVDSYLESMPEFQVNGQFSVARFQKILETTLYNATDFLELINTSLLIDQPRLGLIFTSFALPNEITDVMALVNQERDIQYVVLPSQLVSKQAIQISEEAIVAFYNQHQDVFKTPEQVSVEYVELSIKDLMNGIHPTDGMLKKYYSDNGSSYTQPMQWKLDSIVVPLASNATSHDVADAQKRAYAITNSARANGNNDFSSLAKEFNAKNNKLFSGWVSINKIPADYQKAVLSVNKVGQVSNPVRSKEGLVIFKVVEIKEPSVQPFEQVKDQIKTAYIRQQAEEQFANMREKLANVSYEHPESLEQTAKKLGLTIKTSELFSKDKGGNGIAANSKIREAAFSNEVLNQQNNSDVIQMGSDDAIVIRIKTHTPASLLALNAVKNQIIDKLKLIETESRLTHIANEIKQALQTGASAEQIAHQYHVSWNKVGFIGRHSNKMDSAILDTAFAMPKPKADKKSFAVAKVPAGYAVIALNAVRDGSVGSNHEQYQVFAQQIQNTQGLMEYELYKQSQMDQAKIVNSLS